MNVPSSRSGDPNAPETMDCEGLRRLLGAYMTRGLAPRREAALRAHAMDCADCQARLMELLIPPWDATEQALLSELDDFSMSSPFEDNQPMIGLPALEGMPSVTLPPALEAALAEEEARTAAEARAYRVWGPRARRAIAAASGAALGLALVLGIASRS